MEKHFKIGDVFEVKQFGIYVLLMHDGTGNIERKNCLCFKDIERPMPSTLSGIYEGKIKYTKDKIPLKLLLDLASYGQGIQLKIRPINSEEWL